MMGQTLLLRNQEWLSSCVPGLCIALAGSNRDIKINDRLPKREHTHEACCDRSCIPMVQRALRTIADVQRHQATIRGYFGGCINKSQPSGRLEIFKCVRKMHVLEQKITQRSSRQKLCAATGRMVTDLEMNTAYRGAVEAFNLCRNLGEGDVFAAECVPTFGQDSIDARN